MSEQKYYQLISDKEVHARTTGKILPADSFSELVTGKELVDKIHREAEEYRRQVISECEAIKEEAIKEGFQEGYSQWVSHLAKMEEEIKRVREDMQKLVMPISLKAAKKIVASELALSPSVILDVVTNTLKSVAQHKRIIIYVSRQDMDALEKGKGKIKEIFESLESLSIREREDVEQGGCIIETEGGIINARLKDRWRTLEAWFEALEHNLKQQSQLAASTSAATSQPASSKSNSTAQPAPKSGDVTRE